MYRLFVAIDLPPEVKERLAPLRGGLPGARWVDPEQLHLTLRFIGEVDGGILREVREGLGAVHGLPFSLTLQGVGHFPPRGQPRVVWVGVEKSGPLNQLHGRVETALAAVGVERDGRKFSPHITLARLKETPGPRVGRYLEAFGLFRTDPFAVEEITLYSSTLTRHGAVHTPEASYPLTARSRDDEESP
ncbi:MAG: RNA 2',3'-cyclic phosphodiesterase [Nitrospirota bacterium]|jgi:2'-5' RNA ligase